MTLELLRMQKFFQESSGIVTSKRPAGAKMSLAGCGGALFAEEIETYVPLYGKEASRRPSVAEDHAGQATDLKSNTIQLQERMMALVSSYLPTQDNALATWRARSTDAMASLREFASQHKTVPTSGFEISDLVGELEARYSVAELREMRSRALPNKENVESKLRALRYENPNLQRIDQLGEDLRSVNNLFVAYSAADVPKLLCEIPTFINVDALRYIKEDLARHDSALQRLESKFPSLEEARASARHGKKHDIALDSTEAILSAFDQLLNVKRTRLDSIGINGSAPNAYDEGFERWRSAIHKEMSAVRRHQEAHIDAYDKARNVTLLRSQKEKEDDETQRRLCSNAIAALCVQIESNSLEQEKILMEVRNLYAQKIAPLAARRQQLAQNLVTRVSKESLRRAECANVTSLCDTYLNELRLSREHAVATLEHIDMLHQYVTSTEEVMSKKDPKEGLEDILIAEQQSFLASFSKFSAEYGEYVARLEVHNSAISKQQRANACQLEAARESLDPNVEKYVQDEKKLAHDEKVINVKLDKIRGVMAKHVVTFSIIEDDMMERGIAYENSVLLTAERLSQKREAHVEHHTKQFAQATAVEFQEEEHHLQQQKDVVAMVKTSRPTSAEKLIEMKQQQQSPISPEKSLPMSPGDRQGKPPFSPTRTPSAEKSYKSLVKDLLL